MKFRTQHLSRNYDLILKLTALAERKCNMGIPTRKCHGEFWFLKGGVRCDPRAETPLDALQ